MMNLEKYLIAIIGALGLYLATKRAISPVRVKQMITWALISKLICTALAERASFSWKWVLSLILFQNVYS